MTTVSPPAPKLLTLDARPIPIEELHQDVHAVLRQLLDLVNEMAEDNRQQAQKSKNSEPQSPWAVVEPNRTRRVIMLDAERGAGKTSTLLTLLALWNERGSSDRNNHLLTDHDKPVRALPRLDFDPHPESIHAYAWLVLAFEPVARFIEGKRGRVGRNKSLLEKWGEIYKAALLGWSDTAIDTAISKDLDAFVVDHIQGSRAWHELELNWTKFIDEILSELEEIGELNRNGLIVLPIDDLDLHPSMARQILLALRLLHHPRLVMLLAGDTTHLQDVLEIEIFQKSTRGVNLPDAKLEKSFASARSLSRQLIDKIIPPAHRFELKRLPLSHVVTFVLSATPIIDHAAINQWRRVSVWDLLNLEKAEVSPVDRNAPEDRDRPWRLQSPAALVAGNQHQGHKLLQPNGVRGASLHLLLTAGGLGVSPTYTRRDASNFRALYERTRAHAEFSSITGRAEFADMLLALARDSSGEKLFQSDLTLPKPISMRLEMLRSSVEQRFLTTRPNGGKTEVFAALQLVSADRSREPSPDEHAVEVLLSIWSFAHETLHPSVQLKDIHWSPLVVTRWPEEKFGLTRVFYWPGRNNFRTLCQSHPPLKEHPALAARWLCMNLTHSLLRSDDITKSLREGLRLVQRATANPDEEEAGGDPQFADWFVRYFPILAAPEFDLPPDQQEEILGFFLQHAQDFGTDEVELRSWWRRARDASLLDLLTGRRDATLDDPATERQQGEIEALKRRISEALPDSVWDRNVTNPGNNQHAQDQERTEK